jgi:predicted nucleic acid-binding protein
VRSLASSRDLFVVTTRKLGIEASVARCRIELRSRLEVVVARLDLIVGAIDLHRLHAISPWGALAVKRAAAPGCQRLPDACEAR